MVIKIVLVDATELQQVISLHPTQIVTEDMVLAIPEALANVLGVDVVRDQRVYARARSWSAALAANFEGSAEARKLGRSAKGSPLPEVAQVVVVEVVGKRRSDGRRQTGDE